MIVFDLECRPQGHRFEGWFGSSEDFVAQQGRGLLCCPQCGSSEVAKAVMAPNVGRKGNQMPEQSRQPKPAPATSPATRNAAPPQVPISMGTLPPEAERVIEALGALQSEMLKGSRWVGKDFAQESRAIHYGERDAETIHGQATPEEAAELAEEGISVLPLPFPVAPPGKAN